MIYPSPLRYPGGKRKLARFIADIMVENGMAEGTYVEPFAGGASVALTLLFQEYVGRVIINDLDRSIYAFWHVVLNDPERLCRRIADTAITVEEWERQRKVQIAKDTADFLDLAFSTFFLNRTNRSGIIKGGIIGGKKQAGNWHMDVRFNKDDLIKRIEKISLYSHRIHLYGLDAMDFIGLIEGELDDKTLIYFDPPYYSKGGALYVNHYKHQDHEKLAGFIQGLNVPWILTYDSSPQILDMYARVEKRFLSLNYTATNKKKVYEMIAFSNGLSIPEHNYPSIRIESAMLPLKA
ncbi:DNA adenine methylase [Moorella sp. Hama-1]|uniref:DNA adenine methylase n=1 Tax=Moorella sp. Hama-1 TaxID=2138101 RepID=UPI000D65669D|nr:DNA adenine methylase [Moorella sp. Hama-1]BCV20382.1 DNA methyltransferase [Moorella sp. Hama-1]